MPAGYRELLGEEGLRRGRCGKIGTGPDGLCGRRRGASGAGLEEADTCVGSPWDGTGQLSVDMLKQFLMHEIMEASCNPTGLAVMEVDAT